MPTESPASPDDWNAHWENYADSAVQNPAQRMRHDFIARLLSATAPGEKVRILDLGSGQGDLLAKLSQLFPEASLLGTELSEKGVAISRQKVPRATFIVADIFDPPPAQAAYLGWATHGVCSEVLEHVDDPISLLEQAHKYLAPGASLIVTVPGGPMSAFDRHIGHRQHFDRQSIQRVLEQAGYSVERVYATGFPFFNLYRLLVIAGGKQLERTVDAQSKGILSALADRLMRAFRFLFYGNFRDSRFGWQFVAVARKNSL
jgi:trans-aconitate methyltransferase